MDTLGAASTDAPIPSLARRKRFDVADYHRMAAAGVLGEDDPIELIEGEIIEMSAIGGDHIRAVIALHRLLFLGAADRLLVSVQNPLRLADRSEPEPDLALLRRRADLFAGGQPPLAGDAALVVEVSGNSLQYDIQIKRPLYARHAVPELWIVDLSAGVIEICRNPVDGDYTDVTRAGIGGHIEPLALPGVRIAVADVAAG